MGLDPDLVARALARSDGNADAAITALRHHMQHEKEARRYELRRLAAQDKVADEQRQQVQAQIDRLQQGRAPASALHSQPMACTQPEPEPEPAATAAVSDKTRGDATVDGTFPNDSENPIEIPCRLSFKVHFFWSR
jgi:hypothetical protein